MVWRGPAALLPSEDRTPGTRLPSLVAGAGEQPQTGRATGPAQPRDSSSSFRHSTASLPPSAPAPWPPVPRAQSSAPRSWTPPNRSSPNAAAEAPRALPAAPSGSAGQAAPRARPSLGSESGARGPCSGAGGQGPRPGPSSSFLTNSHTRADKGCPVRRPHNHQEAAATGVLGQDGAPGLPSSGRRGVAGGTWRAPAVPEGLSAGAERAASLLHDCVFRAGLCKAVVPSSSLSMPGRWMSPGRAVPSAGWARRPPALHRWDPGYLASRSHW